MTDSIVIFVFFIRIIPFSSRFLTSFWSSRSTVAMVMFGPEKKKLITNNRIAFTKTYSAATAIGAPSNATLAWSGYCFFRYSIINAIGFAGFSINKLSTIWINRELMFLLLRYCWSSAWTSAACNYIIITKTVRMRKKYYMAICHDCISIFLEKE